MTTFSVGNAAYPTAVQIRDQILSDLTYYGGQAGIAFNVKPGSEHYKIATALANRVSIAIANNKISNDQRNPLTATGDALRDIARVYGIAERPASQSSGPVMLKIATGATPTIPAGWQGTGPNSKKYVTVQIEDAAENGDIITMRSVEAGADTVLVTGSQITWDSAAIASLLSPAIVQSPGIRGGEDTDDDEDIRRRLIDRLSAQAVGGNGASIKGWAEETSASIHAAYVYEAIRGPASFDVAVVASGGDRTLSGTIVDASRSNVSSNMPGGVVSVNETTVVPEELDIVFGMRLPLPESAGGAGGGWRDAVPWPSAGTKITAISGANFTVNSSAAPVVGQSIGLWDRSDIDAPVMRERTVATVSGSAGAWVITLSGSNGFVAVGDYVSAGATNLVAYAATAYAQFLLLGPGEKTDNPDLLPRSARYPSPEVSGPMDITNRQIAAIMSEYDEMAQLTYEAILETGTLTPRSSPSLPPTTASPPRILVCKRLAFIQD
jgi:uncharacterized phage protein gp47/JayE